MLIHIILTGPPRVVLGRPALNLDLPGATCTLGDLLAALADAEPRIARYLRGEEGQPPAPLRPLLNDHLLEPGTIIPDGATVTLLYALAGGTSKESRSPRLRMVLSVSQRRRQRNSPT